MLVIIGFLAGKQTLRRICRWCKRNKARLKSRLNLNGGIPSLATFSRVLSAVDSELLTYAFMDWIGGIVSTKGIHIVIDGKALRAATEKLKDKKPPYVLNAIDAATKLVIAQLAIPEKSSEAAAIPTLLNLLDIAGSAITIDAIGATATILNLIDEKKGYFVQQIKKNCPATYQEIEDIFEALEREKAEDEEGFLRKNKGRYTAWSAAERNRERYEYRTVKSYMGNEEIGNIREDIPCIRCVGHSVQVRIPKEVDDNGNDITPTKEEFLKHGSGRKPMPTEGDQLTDNIQKVGIVSNNDYTAEALAKLKRSHWAIENSLHHVLDEDFLEDKCPARKSMTTLSVLRKYAYNIIRLIQLHVKGYEGTSVIQVMDDISVDIDIAKAYLFDPIPSHY